MSRPHMRFAYCDLMLNTAFRFEGEVWTKITPYMAKNDGDCHQWFSGNVMVEAISGRTRVKPECQTSAKNS